MLKSDVSKGTILRALACATDLLDKCACVSWVDERLMALTLVRLSVKLVFSSETRDVALKLLASEKPDEQTKV